MERVGRAVPAGQHMLAGEHAHNGYIDWHMLAWTSPAKYSYIAALPPTHPTLIRIVFRLRWA